MFSLPEGITRRQRLWMGATHLPYFFWNIIKGNTSLDSPVVLTPGFLNMSDEIVERSMRKKKDFCKDGIPSFDLRITQLNEEDKNMDDKEGSKAVIRYTKKICSGRQTEEKNWKRSYGK
ncbi:unnamed protein product [Lactuca virosa]|uniref:Uncharacterized protein n=1 Tax=Lactuca virosa TaxID=75947 RepID=A0AAU9NAT8_9ASTR|nr:unnamed protein product [Lactuca virosa]